MKQFINIAGAGPVSLPTDDQGNALMVGGGAQVYAGLIAVSAELSDADPPIPFSPDYFADLTTDHLAAAQRVRISATYGAVAFAYAPSAGAETFHPIAQGGMVILDGNANINNLYFDAPSGSSPTVAVTVEG